MIVGGLGIDNTQTIMAHQCHTQGPAPGPPLVWWNTSSGYAISKTLSHHPDPVRASAVPAFKIAGRVKVYILNPCQDAASMLLVQAMTHQKWMDPTGIMPGEFWTSASNVSTEGLSSYEVDVTDAQIRRAALIHTKGSCAHDN